MRLPAARSTPLRARRRLRGALAAGLAAGLAALLGAGGAGCGRAEAPASELRLWAMGREGEVVAALLPGFAVRHPGIRVQVQQVPWSAAHEKLLTAYAGDAMPDLFQLGNTWVPEFVALRALEPLDARIAASRSVVPEDYFPGIWATNAIGGVTYGVPWYVDTRVLFYRRDWLARAGFAQMPGTWAGWREALEALRARLGDAGFPILLPLDEWAAPVLLALQRGAPLLRDDASHADFDEPRFREALAFYVGLFRSGLAPPRGAAAVGNLYRDFAAGRFVMLLTGPWNLGEFAQRLPAELQDAWATAPLPAPEGPGPGLSLAGGASLAVHRGSAHKDAAFQLIEYLSEPEQQAAFHRLSGDLPARRSAWERAGLRDDRHARAFWVQLQAVASPPRIPEWERVAERIARAAEEVVRGERSLDAAVAALDGDVERLLAKRRWMLARGLGEAASGEAP